jgi:hypothetical protein
LKYNLELQIDLLYWLMDFSIGVLVGMQGSMNTAFSFFLLEERETAAALEKIEDFF